MEDKGANRRILIIGAGRRSYTIKGLYKSYIRLLTEGTHRAGWIAYRPRPKEGIKSREQVPGDVPQLT